jgi:phenylacetate-CoA ligase
MKSAGYDPVQDYRGAEDLQRLPVTTKSTIKDLGVDRFVRRGTVLTQCFSETTSGTTGTPIRVYRTRYERALEIAKWLRVLFTNGYSMRDRVLSTSNPTDYALWQSAARRIGLLGRRGVCFQDRAPEAMVDILMDFRPDVLYANRSYLVLMALELGRRKASCEGLKLVVATGEVIDKDHRALCRKAFGVELVESYGSAEMGVMAYETPERDGLHLCEDLTYFEFLDGDGRPVGPGAPGSVVVTDLAGELMPFIRYEQGDLATYQQRQSDDDGGARRITQIVGRDCALFQLEDGTLRSCLDVVGPVKRHEGIAQFQIVQRAHSWIEVLVVAEPPYLDSIRSVLLDELRGNFPAGVRFEVSAVDRIEPDSTGKIQQAVVEVGS